MSNKSYYYTSEKSDWSRAFNQFACELDMINAISAVDIAFKVCLVTKPLGVFSSVCSQKQNGGAVTPYGIIISHETFEFFSV